MAVRDRFRLSIHAAALFAGTLLWSAIAIAGDRREPWDSELYWTAGYPLAILVSAVFGFLWPDRPWRWALALMLPQAFVMALGGSGVSLLPLGLIVIAILSLPPAGAAMVGGYLRRRIA